MDLKNKFKGIPHIYYLNLDCRIDRREHTESSFKHWGIENYTRVSASNYMLENFHDWKHLIFDYKRLDTRLLVLRTAQQVSIFKILEHWLETTNDPYMIYMEDDVNFEYLEYMHFDWEYLMNNIPHDWDSILLGFENHALIPCFLHPLINYHNTGPSLLNRHYVKKLLRLHTIDGKYNFFNKISNLYWKGVMGHPEFVITDYFLNHCGKSYAIPLMPQRCDMGAHGMNTNKTLYKNDSQIFANKAYTLWWKKFRDNYTLKEFFTYSKSNDFFIDLCNVS